jgi:large repetitive protein
MNGQRTKARRAALLSRAAVVAALCGGLLSVVGVIGTATPAAAFSATPQWYNTSGSPVSSLSCGTWYYTTMGAQTGGGSATITLYGGGAGGGGGTPVAVGNTANSAVGGAGAKVIGTFTAAAGQSIATFIGCGGGGGTAHSSGSTGTGGTGGTGYANGANGGMFSSTEGESSGGGGGGGASAVCVYGTAGSPCATLVAVSGGGGGGGGTQCTGNGGSGGVGGAGATSGTTPTETNSAAPGGSASGQGFGGGGGGADSDSQSGGGGGGGGVGAVSGTSSTTATTGGGGAANSTGGAGGAKLSGGTGPAGTAGSTPASGVGAGAGGVGGTNGSGSEDSGGGGGGGGYTGGGGGAGNYCFIAPALGSGGGGAGSSWVSTSYLTGFVNGTNPTFAAGSGTSTACGRSTAQGTSGGSTGTGGSNDSTTSGATGTGYTGCPGGVALTWTALPGAPSGVTGTAGNGQIAASWTAPTDSGTASISGYTVTATPTPSGTTVSHTFNSSATSETLTGLTNGTAYNLSVAAVTSVGTGPSANASNNPITPGIAPAITSANNTTFTVGSAGSFTITTTGAPTAATISESGSLPSGVTFVNNSNGTATLSGTPAAGTGGSYGITITAANGISPNASQSFTLTVDQAPAITSGSSTTFSVGSAGTFSVTTTGFPTSALSETGSLPSGVTFTDNGNGTATLAGTPAAGTSGVYPLTIGASNNVSPAASQSFTLTVDGAPTITSANNTTFAEGSAGSFTVTTAGLPAPALSETGTLPSGVTFSDNGNGTATLAGTPAAGTSNVYVVTITASNGFTPIGTQSFTLTVDGPPHITSADSTSFAEGSAGNFTVTTSGLPAPELSETGNLPSGVNFSDNGNGTATLAGTPAAGSNGVYSFSIGASNGISPNASQSFTLTVDVAPTITSATSTTFTEGAPGTFTVTSTGLPTAALTETGNLPSGVSLTDNGDGTGTLAGTPGPGTSGTYTFTITASNGVSPNADQTFTLTVDAAPTITSADNTTFTEDAAGSFTVTSTALPTAALSETGPLPSGVAFSDNGDGTGTLAGTPATGTNGVYTVTITASNGVSPEDNQSFTLTVDAAPVITSGDSTTFSEGSVGSFTVTTSGLPAPALTETGNLPSGVTFTDNGDGTATLGGTPAVGTNGTYSLAIGASNGISPDASQTFALTVDAAPTITSADNATFTEGADGSFTVTSSGLPTPALSESGSLPSGVSFLDNGDGTASLGGTPAVGTNGVYTVEITATNGVSPDATQTFTLTVDAAPAITSADNATFTEGQAGSFTVTTTGYPTPAISETGSLPGGVTFTDNGNGTATLAGTPASGTSGAYSLTIGASNDISPDASQTFTLTVDAAPAITSADNATFTEGQAGSFTVTTTGYPTNALSETGNLPSGVTFVDNGDGTATLGGTPAAGATGGYAFTITASNGVSPNATQSFILSVYGAPTITSADSTSFAEGEAGSFTVTSTGPPTAALSESGNLPSGVTFTDNGNGTGTLAGTPGANTRGSYSITFVANNGVSPNASQSFTLTIGAAPVFTSADTTTFYLDSAGTFTPAASGSPTPTITEYGNLPSGVTFSGGVLSGTPTKRGSFPILFTANNEVGGPVTQNFTLVVAGLTITTTSPLPGATVGAAYSGEQFQAVGGVLPLAWTKVGTLPKGLKLSKSGLLSGTVAKTVTPGTYTFTIKVSDKSKPKQTVSGSFQITVAAS